MTKCWLACYQRVKLRGQVDLLKIRFHKQMHLTMFNINITLISRSGHRNPESNQWRRKPERPFSDYGRKLICTFLDSFYTLGVGRKKSFHPFGIMNISECSPNNIPSSRNSPRQHSRPSVGVVSKCLSAGRCISLATMYKYLRP